MASKPSTVPLHRVGTGCPVRLYTTVNKGKSCETATIFALASGQGRAGIAVIRVSGPASEQVYHRLCTKSRRLPSHHKLVLRHICHPSTGELLDQAALIYFPPAKSYTGEPSLELHLHGGLATIRDTLDALSDLNESLSIRPAEPGEFTRRAFSNGRLDLTTSEALHSLIQSETTVQRRLALRGSLGLQTARYDSMRANLLQAMSLIEAMIDFSDEEGVEDGLLALAKQKASKMEEMIKNELGGESDKRHVGEILSQGVRVAIYGPPNAGKSSLLNALADREAAIVSPIPGTTRDVLQVNLELDGYKVLVYDTAGIREPSDEIEKIGIERAKNAVKQADLSLCVYPCTFEMADIPLLRPDSYTSSHPDLVFLNKSDLAKVSLASEPSRKVWMGSVQTGDGLSSLLMGLRQEITRRYAHALEQDATPLITQARHRFHLLECKQALTRFRGMAEAEDLVLAAEELRYAATALGKVTGVTVSADEILGQIFSTFCIGK